RPLEPRLKKTVNDASSEIAHEYLQEIAPYLGSIDLERIFQLLPGRTLSGDDIEGIFLALNRDAPSDAEHNAFCALHKAGLLGWVHNDRVRGRKVQRFLLPGEGTLEPDDVLPIAGHYVVHPVLSDLIGRLNPTYLDSDDRANIIGYDRPWRDASDSDG